MISIVMPAYNAAATVQQAIYSVVAQTFQEWELIVVDDCSKDETWDKLVQMQARDIRIRVLQNESNLGVAATRNRGVDVAKGEWIAFLDSDDVWMPEKLEKQMQLVKKQKQGVLFFTGSAFMDKTGERKKYVLHVPERISYKQLLKQNLISCSSVLVKKDCIQKYPMITINKMHEDFATWLQILKHEPFAYAIDEPLIIYRLSPDSKSGNKLKAAKMNWATYKYIGTPKIMALANMIVYAIRGVRKYSQIDNG